MGRRESCDGRRGSYLRFSRHIATLCLLPPASAALMLLGYSAVMNWRDEASEQSDKSHLVLGSSVINAFLQIKMTQ